MKKKIIYFIALIVLGFTACEEFEDDRIDHSNIYSSYVKFNSKTRTYNLNENDDTAFLRVDLSVTLYEDVLVTFDFEGDAIYGTDFIVADHDGGEVVSADANSAIIKLKYDIKWNPSYN